MAMDEQVADPSVLGFLAQLLQPQQAEAATSPEQWRQQYLLRQQQARQLTEQRAQQQAVLEQQRQQGRMQLQEAKAKPAQGPVTPDAIAQILQGGQQQQADRPEMPITFGITPGTGTPYFTNRAEAPAFAQERLFAPERGSPQVSPEQLRGMREQVTQQRAVQQASQAAPGGVTPQVLAQSIQFSKLLRDNGYPADLITKAVIATFPQLAEAQAGQATKKQQALSDITLQRQKSMADYNAKISAEKEMNKPLPPGTQTQLQYMDDLNTAIDTIAGFVDNNQHGAFVGPVQGRSYGLRRQVPGGVSADESTMRLALDNAKDLLLRKRSGAQINEKEADRLAALLPKETDDPEVFANSFRAFQTALSKSIESGKMLATITRGQLKAGTTQRTSEGTAQQPNGGTAKLAKQADVNAAMKQAGGNRQKALQLLRQQGFTGAE